MCFVAMGDKILQQKQEKLKVHLKSHEKKKRSAKDRSNISNLLKVLVDQAEKGSSNAAAIGFFDVLWDLPPHLLATPSVRGSFAIIFIEEKTSLEIS